MRFRPLLALCSPLFLLACNGSLEESVKIHDADRNARVLEILDGRNVAYRVSEDGRIFYPVEERESVRRATEEVIGVSDQTRNGASVRVDDAHHIAERLTRLGIEYEAYPSDNTVTFLWSTRADEEAMNVVLEVVTASEEAGR